MIYHKTGFLSSAQVARIFGLTSQSIRKAIKENRVDAYKLGNQWVFKCGDIDKLKLRRKKCTK